MTSTLTVGINGNGSVNSITPEAPFSCSSGSCSADFASGTTFNLAASASAGSTFVGWTGGSCSGASHCTILLDANKSVTANFSSSPLVKVGASFFGTLSEGYIAIADGGTMEITESYFAEDLTLNRDIRLVIEGGKSADYSGVTGMTSIRSMTIETGEVTVNGLVIE